MSDNFEEIIIKVFEILNSNSEKKILKATSKQIIDIYNENFKGKINKKSKSKTIKSEQNDKKQSKPKKENNTNKIKRPMSAYMFFCNDKRQSIKEQYPDKSFGELTKKLSELWKDINSNEKKIYVEKAENDKKRYNIEKDKLEKL
jgi:hypothetical protein